LTWQPCSERPNEEGEPQKTSVAAAANECNKIQSLCSSKEKRNEHNNNNNNSNNNTETTAEFYGRKK